MTCVTFNDGYISVNKSNLKIRWIYPENAEERNGDKPVLVFIHEGLGCIDMWKSFPEKLCMMTGLKGLMYDRLGYGGSDASDAPFSVDFLEREALYYLPGVMSALGIEKSILVGHSDGATIALTAAALWEKNNRPHIYGVISESAHIYVEPVTVKEIKNAVKAYEKGKLKEKLMRYHGEKTDAVFRRWSDIWLSDAFQSFNIENVASKINSPLLLMQGDEDEYATPEQFLRIYELALEKPKKERPFPIKAELITGAKHIPHLQAQEDVLTLSSRFIRLILKNKQNLKLSAEV